MTTSATVRSTPGQANTHELEIKHILVPLDGSLLAEHALPYVYELAPLLNADVMLLEVIDDQGEEPYLTEIALSMAGQRVTTRQSTRDLVVRNVRGYLEEHAAALARGGMVVQTAIRVGSPAEAITEMADAKTLIVMATHGYNGARRWALGSVADKVVQASNSPVLLVRGEAKFHANNFKRLMVPLDGSAFSLQALPIALAMARANNSELLLMRAIEPFIDRYAELQPFGYTQPPEEDWILQQRAAIKREFAIQAEQIRAQYPTTHAVVHDGYPAEAIVNEAEHQQIDVIVMATHGRGGLRRWALGSVADKVLHITNTPLLLMRSHTI